MLSFTTGFFFGFVGVSCLAIVFLTDEDDCSHDGSIREAEMPSDACRNPSSYILRDSQGNPIPDPNGSPIRGEMHKLTPISNYIDFLKGLQRSVLVFGLVGDPIVYKNGTKEPIAPGGCSNDQECGSGAGHLCGYVSPSLQGCGGCKSPDANALPGFRIHELIQSFGSGEKWHPVCSDEAGYRSAMTKFARRIIDSHASFTLPKKAMKPYAFTIQVKASDGKVSTITEQAKETAKQCSRDVECSDGQACFEAKCHTDGWVYFETKAEAELRLVGNAKQALKGATGLSIRYTSE